MKQLLNRLLEFFDWRYPDDDGAVLPPFPEKPYIPPSPVPTDPYEHFSRESPWKDQGRELLQNPRQFTRWLPKFRPEKDDKLPRGLGFEVEPPASYPVIVIYTRIRRIGLTECEFYWDYVYPADFTPPKPERNKRSATS